MLIRTQRLIIRPIEKEDWPAIRRIWQDFNESPYAGYDLPHCTEADSVKTRIAKWAEATAGREHMFFAVCLEGEVIGFYSFNIREKGYEIGYSFLAAHHGKGYAKESLTALLAHFHSLGIRDFSAGTALANTPSVALLKSVGFTRTGTEKVSFFKDAEGKDIVFDGGIFELHL